MTNELMPASPFDALQLSNGRWSARALMTAMGYSRWENFLIPLNRARKAADNQGYAVAHHFLRSQKVAGRPQGGGASSVDFELTRFAAYLVAMNGDPNKSEVAAAQAYFVVKTREAETSEPDARTRAELVTKADLARMVLEIEEEKSVIAAALESAAPAVAYHDRYVANDDAAQVKVWAAQFGLTQPQAFALLMDKKLIYRVFIGERFSESEQRKVAEYEYRAYAPYLDWFDLRPQHNVPRHHNGQVRQTLYVRQQFALQIADKCGLSTQLQLDGGES